MKTPTSKRSNLFLNKWVWLGCLLLFAISIPWYWPADSVIVWLGLPAWVLTTIVSAFGISLMTAWLLLFHWPSPPNHRTRPHD